jgi:hypothetical protein
VATTDRTTKQLLLRVSPELHDQLAAHARRSGRSMNAIANDALRMAVDPVPVSDDSAVRRERVRERALVLGWLVEDEPALPVDLAGDPVDAFRTIRQAIGPLPPGVGATVEEQLLTDRRVDP